MSEGFAHYNISPPDKNGEVYYEFRGFTDKFGHDYTQNKIKHSLKGTILLEKYLVNGPELRHLCSLVVDIKFVHSSMDIPVMYELRCDLAAPITSTTSGPPPEV